MVPLARYQGCVVYLLNTVNDTLGVVNQHYAVQRPNQRECAVSLYCGITEKVF